MNIMALNLHDQVAVILGNPDYNNQVSPCFRALADRRIPFGVHSLSSEKEIAREELDALALTDIRVVVVVDRITDHRRHLPGMVAEWLAEHEIVVIGVVLPSSKAALRYLVTPNDTSLLWSTNTEGLSAGVTAATIVMTDKRVALAGQCGT